MDGMPIKLFMTATTALPLGSYRATKLAKTKCAYFYIVERPARLEG